MSREWQGKMKHPSESHFGRVFFSFVLSVLAGVISNYICKKLDKHD